MSFLAGFLLLAGAAFLTVSCLGLVRLPDFYSRAHAVGKAETLGSILTLAGLAIYQGWSLTSFKILLILAVMALTSPTAIHALSRAAVRSGLEIWRREGD